MRQLNSRTTVLTWDVINSGKLWGGAYVVDHATSDLVSRFRINDNVLYGVQHQR